MAVTSTSAPSKDKLLLLLSGKPRPEWIPRIESKFPKLEVCWVDADPGNTGPSKEAEVWQGVTILVTYRPPPAELMSSVRFVQLVSAGADMWAQHEVYKDEKVIFCTANGCHPPQIAEWVIGAWLSFQHHFARYAANMQKGHWEAPYESTVQDSTECRMGILGYGAIGRQCARVANAMGMEIYAYTRSERVTAAQRKDDSYCVPGTGDPDGLLPTKWFHGASKESINAFLGQDLDILVVCAPLTTETRGIISREQFEILSKKKTFLANVGRGPHIDQEALIEALETGKIRGAALDVTDPEPLPSEHPLWKAPNLLITPHVSWQTTNVYARIMDILETNLERLDKGEKPINMVNRELHY
ncbi:D-3-phosphoglycerate dehydrogenase [Pseudomassariella vexata]|uniref:D-3-phosphoglycerate dehydrogenase n=1 Tax=Pseudomassariella vexata TaxID=1141098 RepID=A0A1Y2DZW1_9PEZI|nr:D-3-phosphoglycerate dehydrogenase [Pseudomassariella vexata]ORY64823.1 D-3-phosphoglycerate dehydrogenase [Pseudomassariella vexata]